MSGHFHVVVLRAVEARDCLAGAVRGIAAMSHDGRMPCSACPPARASGLAHVWLQQRSCRAGQHTLSFVIGLQRVAVKGQWSHIATFIAIRVVALMTHLPGVPPVGFQLSSGLPRDQGLPCSNRPSENLCP